MKKNKKIPKKMSVVATNTMRFGAIIVFFFVMVILNLLSSSSCTQLENANGALEREIAKLDDSCVRESTRWAEMKTSEKIEELLLRHGLAMKTPRPDQTVRMTADGVPFPGQLSIAKAKMRGSTETVTASSHPIASRAARPAPSGRGKGTYRRKKGLR